MITIHNLRDSYPSQPYDVKVDRTSVLGNPFVMKNESLRDEVCDKYQTYFDNTIAHPEDNSAFMNELRRLYKLHKAYGKLRLFCWCYPKRCHAETIKEFLNQFFS